VSKSPHRPATPVAAACCCRNTSPTTRSSTFACPHADTRRQPRAALEISDRLPDIGILLLSTHVEVREAVELFSATASRVGYLLKDSVCTLEELIDALSRISEGGTVLDPKLIRQQSRHGGHCARASKAVSGVRHRR